MGFAGCGHEVEFDQLFAPVYRESTVDIWTTSGETMIEQHEKTGSWSPRTRLRSNQLRGILSIDSEEHTCAEILVLVDRFVQTKTGQYRVEGDIPSSLSAEQEHVHAIWMYNREDRHGELYVWRRGES